MAKPTQGQVDALSEMFFGNAMTAAFVLHLLEKNGVLKHEEVAVEILRATEAIPDEMSGHPRYAGMMMLRVLLLDPELRHTLPFPWPAQN